MSDETQATTGSGAHEEKPKETPSSHECPSYLELFQAVQALQVKCGLSDSEMETSSGIEPLPSRQGDLNPERRIEVNAPAKVTIVVELASSA